MIFDKNLIERIKSILPYPFIDGESVIDDIPKRLEEKDEEFCFSFDFSPEFIDRLCYCGYLPMATMITSEIEILLLKLHEKRCILRFKNLHIPKNIKRYCDDLEFSVDSDLTGVIDGIKKKRFYDCWLYPNILSSFYGLHNQDKFRTKIHSIEITHKGRLVAGEVGYSVGAVYTSLSGFYDKNGSGKVQLMALSKFLESREFAFWDLGMAMDYKLDLGAETIEREVFLEMVKKNRDDKKKLSLKTRRDVRELIFN